MPRAAPSLDPTWTCVDNDMRWVRADGAAVRWDNHSPHLRPYLPTARMWTAWEPDPSQAYLARPAGRGGLRGPRRFVTAQAAMRAVDRDFPLQGDSTC